MRFNTAFGDRCCSRSPSLFVLFWSFAQVQTLNAQRMALLREFQHEQRSGRMTSMFAIV